jgi:hypothetical protein
MGWSEATVIFPEPSENAKRGFGQVIRMPSDSTVVAGATVAPSSARLILRSKMASIAVTMFVDRTAFTTP